MKREKEIGHGYLNFKMWSILHSHRAESARCTCRVYGESVEQKGDRNEVRVVIIYTSYFSITKVLLEILCLFMTTIRLRFTEFS